MTTLKKLFSSQCKFVIGAVSVDQIPDNFIAEVAFAGRSNVGKSSLINAVIDQKNYARTSKLPGCTQQINFFLLMEKIFLVDLPGYGYASVSQKNRKLWDDLIPDYLIRRSNLRRIFLLIDSRHGIKKIDEEIMDALDRAAVSYQIILTKIDKIKDKDVAAIKEQVESQILIRAAAHPCIIVTSSKKFLGIRDVQSEIMKLLME
ncbi:MAG: ribosome biogenesis GTP-binding protein YihA/YsxC [Holosporaceae bacterium]|jgi:GTP-binding protein|nr:ribosome biogenesis GTP-binding protein YihA/YsxC [Holosporaceae bacterium]